VPDDRPAVPLDDTTQFDFPWMPLYVDDLLALAATLDAEQLGGFMRLKAFAWRQAPRCTLPDADARLAVISGLGPAWSVKGEAIRELLTPAPNGRLLDEALLARFLEQVQRYKVSQIRRLAGGKGGKRSAEVRGHQPPSKDRSNPPTKTGDLLRRALGSELSSSSGNTHNSEQLEAPAEAPVEAKPLDLSHPAFDHLRPAARLPSSSPSAGPYRDSPPSPEPTP
jgi:hypothetical protein